LRHRIQRRVERGERRDRRLRRSRGELGDRARDQRTDLRRRREALPPGLDPVEQPGRGLWRRLGRRGAREKVKVLDGRRARSRHAEALALVHAAAVGGDLAVRGAEERVVPADVHLQIAREIVGRLDRPRRAVPIDAARLPGRDVAAELLRVKARIGRRLERLDRQHRRGGVVAVRVGRAGRETRDDHVGAEAADHRDDVGEHGVLAPDAQRLFRALREAEVARAREELLGAVAPPGGEQLLRADEAERGPLLGADEVLAAVAARDR
jgi:hypothetical protein